MSLLIANEGFLWRSFLLCGSLPFSSAVVVSLRPLSTCHGSERLVTALFFSSRVPYLRDGVTLAGSRVVCPRLERRFRVPVWVRYPDVFLVALTPLAVASLRALSL